MKYLMLSELVDSTGSNEAGFVLFKKLKTARDTNTVITLCIEPTESLSSSFLNSSIGLFLETYGIVSFKETVKFKGNKAQFKKLSHYISMFSQLENIEH